jgi:hypothetical protein
VASDDRITVLHPVRAFNGIGWFREFVDSFRSAPPGIPCDLFLVLKGSEFNLSSRQQLCGRQARLTSGGCGKGNKRTCSFPTTRTVLFKMAMTSVATYPPASPGASQPSSV